MKFSLRTAFFLFTVAVIVFGFRYGQRSRLVSAADQLNSVGAALLYRQQKPYHVTVPTTVFDTCRTVEVPYNEVLEDGSVVPGIRTEMAHQNRPITVTFDEYRTVCQSAPQFRVLSFLIGTHDDIAIASLMVPLKSVNETTFAGVPRIYGVDGVVLQVEKHYFSINASKRFDVQERQRQISPYLDDVDKAVELIKDRFPGAKIYRQGMVYDAG